MKILLIIVATVSLLFGYQKGDTLDADMYKHLELQNRKLYIIDFFASWYGSCKKELPLIAKANKQLDPEKVEIIGIDVDKDVKKGKATPNR